MSKLIKEEKCKLYSTRSSITAKFQNATSKQARIPFTHSNLLFQCLLAFGFNLRCNKALIETVLAQLEPAAKRSGTAINE